MIKWKDDLVECHKNFFSLWQFSVKPKCCKIEDNRYPLLSEYSGTFPFWGVFIIYVLGNTLSKTPACLLYLFYSCHGPPHLSLEIILVLALSSNLLICPTKKTGLFSSQSNQITSLPGVISCTLFITVRIRAEHNSVA